jgi:hypothetical protein
MSKHDKVLKLLEPIQVGEDVITEIIIRRPTIDNYRVLDALSVEIEQGSEGGQTNMKMACMGSLARAAITELVDLPPEKALLISPGDQMAVAMEAMGFYMDSPPGG